MQYRAFVLVLACFTTAALAQDEGPPGTLGFNGSLGTQAALLVMDGEARSVHMGQSVHGVKLVSMEGDLATVEVAGQRRVLRLGASPGRIGRGSTGGNAGQPQQIVLSVGPGGHFTAAGTINGHATQFLVDTGATSVSIGQAEAERLGLSYRDGRHVVAQTANGSAPAYVLTLDSVRVNEVEVRNVEAIVVPSAMSHILLGNSFLNRFQMRRDNEILTLDLRY
ncbi:MAG TPA: retropepsin-like aspartic protease [Burkholderiaceae bacterium]|jgi:aspartyl protease family protein